MHDSFTFQSMHHNTYTKVALTFFMYPTEEGTYVAACQELSLVCEGKDPESLKYRILGNARSYITNVKSNNLGEHLLNQSLPQEILKEFNGYRAKKRNEDFQKWMEDLASIMKFKELSPH